MTDIVVAERRPKLFAESPQRLTVRPESKLDHDTPEELCLGQEDVISAAHGATSDSKPDTGDSETQENLERNNKECSSLEDEHTQM